MSGLEQPSLAFLALHAGTPLPWAWVSSHSIGAVWMSGEEVLGGFASGGSYGSPCVWLRRRSTALDIGALVVSMPMPYGDWPEQVRALVEQLRAELPGSPSNAP